ncbi:MAG: hypothetical protein KDD82_30600, partial [Planctomycetes bacterium]|nr:hypothetical protein [Planctomycetota bacterium]
MRTLWVPLVCVLLSLAGCQSEPPSRLELRRTHYVLPPPTEPAPLDPARQMVLEAEWPAPYTVMRPFADDVIRVRQNRWVACDASGRSYRLETACDEGV